MVVGFCERFLATWVLLVLRIGSKGSRGGILNSGFVGCVVVGVL